MEKLRIAAFGGFRSIPPKPGGAGSDKFAFELYPRIVKRGHTVLAYCRIYPGGDDTLNKEYEGVKIRYYKTVKKAGFDTLVHSFKATFDVIFRNRADVVHLHSGANSIWAILLRLAGKRVVVSQFAMDWKRDKWPWYGKLFYKFSNYITAYLPSRVAFDNIFTKEYFEKRFNRKYDFIPYGSEVPVITASSDILERLKLEKDEYFLFVGRFIPDKGLHLLVEAFQQLDTKKKLVMIGGAPNPGEYESKIKSVQDDRILFPGYLYGDETNLLMKNAYAYVQPSLIEGLSPVILTVMGLATPLVCSDIPENTYITSDNALHFRSGDAGSLKKALETALADRDEHLKKAAAGKKDIQERFNWESVADQYIDLFKRRKKEN
jgi:glycosyltransferase involved in cell wall biosynthesis